MAPPDRHSLAWLDPGAGWIALAGSPSLLLQDWFAAGRPAVVARRQGDEPAGWLRLGVALSPAHGKQRLSLVAQSSAIVRTREPLSLAEVIGRCPPEWTELLELLCSLVRGTGLTPRVYGSFAWQALTGERYVRADSDIDLLWRPRGAAQVHALLAALLRWEHVVKRRADGEIVLPGGDAVCWRELAVNRGRLLVKSRGTIALKSRSEILAGLA